MEAGRQSPGCFHFANAAGFFRNSQLRRAPFVGTTFFSYGGRNSLIEAVLNEVIDEPAIFPPIEAVPGPLAHPREDEMLILRSQAGQRAAFEQLVRGTARLVFARIYLEVGRREGVEDLVQETFLIAWRSIGQVTEAAGFRAWLLSVAHTVVIDAGRRKSRQKRGGGIATRSEETNVLAGIAASTPGPPELAGQAEARQQVLAVLRSLPDEYRLPLTLRYLQGADYESIARQLGITNGSLRGLLHRGAAMMKREMIKTGVEM